jgi:glycosyltransferase involved in cell wall biosynthesis
MGGAVVSVIMPARNAERYIAEAIASVVAQSFGDWELIAIDDGSSDRTWQILQGQSDARIVSVRTAPSGVSAARNTGLGVSSGEFVAFLDADDVFLPNGLAEMVGHLERQADAGCLVSDGYYSDECLRPIMRISRHRPRQRDGEILEALILSPSLIGCSAVTLTRRSLLRRYGIGFDTSLGIGEDWDFFIQVARNARFAYVDALTCKYRIHDENTSKVSSSERYRKELARGRLKLLAADWFGDLLEETRGKFHYDLLTRILAGDPSSQRAVVDGEAFAGLSGVWRARLLRSVAADCITRSSDLELAMSCLLGALALRPGDARCRGMRALLRAHPPTCRAVVSAWQGLHRRSSAIKNTVRGGPVASPLERSR